MSSKKLTHLDDAGRARMVDVGGKEETAREAVASGRVDMEPATARLIAEGRVGKGDVLAAARIAGIQGLKQASTLIPLCHPIRVTGVEITFDVRANAPAGVAIEARVRAHDRTGAEMEALTAVSTAALTIYDMCKAADRGMQLTDIRLERKSGGKSGDWRRDRDASG